jgi:ribosomal protein L11 methyltransferase
VTPSQVTGLETVWVEVPEDALDAYEAALASACRTVGFFFADEDARIWRVEGVKEPGVNEGALTAGLALAALVTGVEAALGRSPTEVGGWLARTLSTFPEQLVGRRFAVRGTHLTDVPTPGRIPLLLDAGVAFGSGEHGSTRGCLRALERVAYRRPRRILDLGCGSGILAMAAAKLLHRPALATDIDHWSVRVARENTRLNHLARRVRCEQAVGWQPAAQAGAPYDLVFANILARPLCRMAQDLAANLAPGGTAILAGLLRQQTRMVLAAHRSAGLHMDFTLQEGNWTTLVLRRTSA